MSRNYKIKTRNRHILKSLPTTATLKLHKTLSQVESRSMHGQVPIAWDKARNFNIFDIDGNKFIDFTSTIFVANIGHSNSRLIKYIKLCLKKNLLNSYAYINRIREKLKENKIFKEEILNYHKKGQKYWLSLSITPILDENNNIEKFIAIESDITEQKNQRDILEKKLKEATERI